jgi:hypothetical protein
LVAQCIDHRHGIVSVDLNHHDVARVPFDQNGYLTVLVAKQQIPLSLAEHGAIFNSQRPLTDADGVGDPAMVVGFLRVLARTTHRAGASKRREKLFFWAPRDWM